MNRLGIGIMAVPERHSMVMNLISKLDLDKSVIAWDENHDGHIINWWRAADIALLGKPTHALIMEDDALPCLDFTETVKKIIDIYPDRTIGFFTRNKEILDKPAGTLIKINDVPTDIAVVYPVKELENIRIVYNLKIDSFDRKKRRWGYGADEMRKELDPGKVVWTTVPSLIQHGGAEKSSLNHHYPGNLSRNFIGENISGLSIDWNVKS